MLTALAIFIHVSVYINYMTSSKNTALLNDVDVVNDVDVKTSPGCSYSKVFRIAAYSIGVQMCSVYVLFIRTQVTQVRGGGVRRAKLQTFE